MQQKFKKLCLMQEGHPDIGLGDHVPLGVLKEILSALTCRINDNDKASENVIQTHAL